MLIEFLKRFYVYLEASTETRMRFCMAYYCRNEDESVGVKDHECGTAGCLVGHAPLLGIGNDLETWHQVAHLLVPESYNCRDTYKFVFGSRWSDDPWQGIARCWHYLQKGMPITFDYTEKYEVPSYEDLCAYCV